MRDKEAIRRRGARLTAIRRASAAKIRAEIATNGRSPLPDEPRLLDPNDLILTAEGKPKTTTTYKPEYANFAAEMCRLGATDMEVARGLGISLSVLWHWQGNHEEFFKAFLEGKDFCDDRVQRALYQRAVGYSHPDLHISSFQGRPVVVPYLKHVPGDVGAQSRWLKARRKGEWADKTEINLTGDDTFNAMWKAISTGQVVPLLTAGEPVDGDDPADSGTD